MAEKTPTPEEAQEALRGIYARLTPDQLQQVEKMVAEFSPTGDAGHDANEILQRFIDIAKPPPPSPYEEELSFPPLSSEKPKGKYRLASRRALLALELHTQLSRRGYFIDDNGNRRLNCTRNEFSGDVKIPMSLKLIERVQKYLLHDCPKSIWQMPDFRDHHKAHSKEEEAKLTLKELADARGIKDASAERRFKRRK